MSTESATPKRRYEKQARAAQEQATRLRIVDAAIDLHRSVGPARTTISAIAEHAGVRRRHRLPALPRRARADPRLLRDVGGTQPAARPRRVGRRSRDPAARLEAALDALYGWYERVEPSSLGAARRRGDADHRGDPQRRIAVLSPPSRTRSPAGWGASGTAARRLRATLGLALDSVRLARAARARAEPGGRRVCGDRRRPCRRRADRARAAPGVPRRRCGRARRGILPAGSRRGAVDLRLCRLAPTGP